MEISPGTLPTGGRSKSPMYYVYRYIGKNKEVLYVGITQDMKKRVYQHKRDKLAEVSKSARIEYFAVKYREDADLLETYLISHFNTGQRFNVSKTKKGNVSFLRNCEYLPWIVYDGSVDESLKPFILSVGCAKVRREERELLGQQNKYRRKFLKGLLDSIGKEYNKEKRDFNYLERLSVYGPKSELSCTREELMTGVSLHRERCGILADYYNNLLSYVDGAQDDIDYQKYINLLDANKNKIRSHEYSLLANNGEN